MSDGLKLSVLHDCGSVHVRCHADRTGDPTKTLMGHILRKPVDMIAQQAITWNPAWKRKRGRPRNAWRSYLEADVKERQRSGIQLKTIGEVDSGPECLAESCWHPMPQEGDEGFG